MVSYEEERKEEERRDATNLDKHLEATKVDRERWFHRRVQSARD